MKCNRCKEQRESTCPCTVTAVATMQTQQIVNVPSPLSKTGMMQEARRIDVPFPFQTTIFICAECNAARVAIELISGPMAVQGLAKWLAFNEGEDRQNILSFRGPKGEAS